MVAKILDHVYFLASKILVSILDALLQVSPVASLPLLQLSQFLPQNRSSLETA
jgi:hypothetical protein